MDLHIHTPASADYQDKHVSYLDILRQAEARGLDILAFTDHNSVRGYQDMLNEIEQLEYLSQLDRAEPDESRRLAEYKRLLDKILLLPGFEFTATFGFHILGIFPPDTPVRKLEHILLSLNIPINTLDEGSSNVGASSDVLTCYQVIHEHGGLVIPAHVNSSHGVAMKGIDFVGGQTRIAYTQDPNIHALEVTDLEKRGRYTTARFFDGTKPGYPRRMRCIQGSDAHRLTANPQRHKDLGVGERVTEISLPECTFDALRQVLEGRDFSLTRPYRSSHDPYDFIQSAREEGESIVQSFHPSMARKGGHLNRIVEDICAFANTNGGTIYIGVGSDPKTKPEGIKRVSSSIDTLYAQIDKRLTPEIDVEIDAQTTQKQTVLRIQVPYGGAKVPYVIDGHRIYIRDEAETTLAVRDEIVRLVLENAKLPVGTNKDVVSSVSTANSKATSEHVAVKIDEPSESPSQDASPVMETRKTLAPLTGVEVVGSEKRRGKPYHMMRDLRNNNIIHNVTRDSARRLWHYAIIQAEENTFDESKVKWDGDFGLIRRYKKAGAIRYDLAQRTPDKAGKPSIRIYYGVTDDGMHGPWSVFIEDDTEE